jgi:hypothetical protein
MEKIGKGFNDAMDQHSDDVNKQDANNDWNDHSTNTTDTSKQKQ